MTIFVLDNTESSQYSKLFTILGIDYVATPRAWMNIPLMLAAGIVVALLIAPVDTVPAQILVGIGYGILIMLSSFCHGLGHVISSKLVNAPMQFLVATATVHITLYADPDDDDEEQPRSVHIIRALGGPVLNLLLGIVAVVIYLTGWENHFVLFFAIVNLFFAAFTFLPIPTLDGAVIFGRSSS